MKQTIKFLDVLDIQRKRSSTLGISSLASKNHLSILSNVNQSNNENNSKKFKSLLSVQKRKSFLKNNNTTNISNIDDTKNNQSHLSTQSKYISHGHGHHTLSNNSSIHNPGSKFPFFKALHFNDSKFQQYPSWLTSREDFMSFMYKNYEAKLLTIPKICQKQGKERASDQKYFISLYLQQIQIFQNLPQLILDIILTQIKTKKYQPNQVIHNQNKQMPFMAVIFVGSVEFTKGNKVHRKQRNEILMSQAFYKSHHPTIVSKQQTVLLCLNKNLYERIQAQLKQDIYEKNRAQISDMMKSDFFVELHLKQKRAKSFYDGLTPEFYFKNEQICEAGQQANHFYLHFKGQVLEQNHIYIRQHNKWPLPNRRWEVRAVYNSYQNENYLKQFSFFGDQQIIGQYKFKSSYYAKSFCILYSMPAQVFKKSLTVQDLKRLKKYRNQHVDINYNQFEQKVRSKVKQQIDNRKIIRKAIDTSFLNKTVQNLSLRKMSLLSNFENSMLQKSFTENKDNQNQENNKNKSFFK